MAYSPEYLLEIARSARFPRTSWDQDTFPSKDGWKVRAFYDAGDWDYLDALISPNGEVIDSEAVPYHDPRMPNRDAECCTLLFWDPDPEQYTDR
jgi:hypothetical protein